MSNQSGKIAKPVEVFDPQKVLGALTVRDVGNLCLNGNINKWSKHKPVLRPNRISPLTDEEFKGTGVNGEYYGLRCTLAEFTLSPELHDVDYEYICPKGGINSPFRITDFDGYDQYAEPDPIGEIHYDPVYWKDEITSGRTLPVKIYHYEWKNTTGVNLKDIIGNLNGFGDVDQNIYGCYPLIMIDGDVRCLQNTDKPVIGIGHQGEYQCTTFGTKNSDGKTAYWNNWVVPIDLLKDKLLGTYKATVFLFYPLGTRANTFIEKCKKGWVAYESAGLGDDPVFGPNNVQTFRAFPVPEATGINLTLKRHVGPTVEVTILKTGVRAEVRWPAASYYDDSAINSGDIYHITVRVSGSPNPDITISGGSFAVDLEAPEKTGAGSSNVLTRTWNQLGFIGVPGQTVYFTWSASHNNIQLEGSSGSATVPNT